MKFYEIDNALQEAIIAADKPVRLRVDIVFDEYIESITDDDIIEASFYGLKEAAGGTSARGEISISNEQAFLWNEVMSNENAAGREVRVSFSLGEGLPYFERFVFYIDEKGIQDVRGSGRKRYAVMSLRDLSYKLRKTDEQRDWSSPAVFTYSVVCDKTQPEKSLVHGIAKRAGLSSNDIDCSTIPIELPYIKLSSNIWAELSSMATAYRCHLECAPEKPLVFAHSPYQTNEELESVPAVRSNKQCSYLFTGEDIFYLRITERADLYRNTVRLKVNMPVSLEKQEIWRYDDAPVLYDDHFKKYYPFRDSAVREIEKGLYEAKYRIIDESGKERNVVFADDIDTKEEAESRLDYSGDDFSYAHFDTKSFHDKALLTLKRESEGDLKSASIFGKPIILDLNRSCFLYDADSITAHGTAALNITGSYFSEQEINGKKHYEDWVIRELAERIQARREFTVKTHRALFNARVGAKVQLTMRNEKLAMKNEMFEGVITSFSFMYKRDSAFVSTFNILEL